VPQVQFHPLSPALWAWQIYDPTVKSELFSSAFLAESGTYLVDPVPLSEEQLAELFAFRPVVGIVVTNANHQRSACAYAERFSTPLFARAGAFAGSKPPRLTELGAGSRLGPDLEIVAIDGAAAGEIVLYHASNGGTLIVGDALINFEPYGFTFLPRKYCLNDQEMRFSLRQLLAKPAKRMLFAHGTPILSDAAKRLRELLEGDSR
jgi:glyoxylase-like metal-dependent hydrolase (beta-lactamase superfamily II)